MVKEYLTEKLDEILKTKEIMIDKKEHMIVVRDGLRNNIIEIQEKSDVDFEIFSPRNAGQSSRGKLNEMYQQLDKVKKQIVGISRELDTIEQEENNFKYMLTEIAELERKAK